jgi:hypothetical protein
MADDLIIELELKSLMPVLAGLQSVSDMLDKIGNQLIAIKGMNLRVNMNGGSGGSGSAIPRPPSLPSWARPSALQSQVNNLQQAQQAGNSSAVSAWNAKILKSLPVPDLPKSLMQRLGGVAMSSRFSLGGGHAQMMPLLGQTIKALGPEIGAAIGPGAVAAMAPLAVAAAVAVAGLKILFDAASSAAETLRSFAMAGAIGGGTASETGRLSALGSSYGMSGDQMANLSRSIAAHLGTQPGMIVGGTAGVQNPLGGTFLGKKDTSADALKLMKVVGDINTPLDKAQTIAHEFNIEFALMDRYMSDGVKAQRELNGVISGGIASATNVKAATDFNARIESIKTSFSQISTVIGGQAMQALQPFVTVLANGMQTVAMVTVVLGKFFDVLMGPMRTMLQIMADLVSGDFKSALDDLNKLKNGDWMKDPAKDLKDAANAMLQATKQGTFGGGERARGATPSGWSGVNMNMSWHTRDAASMGAFG